MNDKFYDFSKNYEDDLSPYIEFIYPNLSSIVSKVIDHKSSEPGHHHPIKPRDPTR